YFTTGKDSLEVYSFRELGGQLGSALLTEGNPLLMHYLMFIPTLIGQGTAEQQTIWLQKAWTCNIIGTYAQTELGHGTFIRGLETTATYDPKTEEFILNCPTLTAYKWWPGGLGHSANYAIVFAQLYTQDKCHGIHAFIVQLRDEETHDPLPGIKVGEIGRKLGMNGANNGYLGIENVRIPRTNMLMKNSEVLPNGTYVKSPSSKLTYGTMIFARVVLVEYAVILLKRAAVIATRYSAVRHQSQIYLNGPEVQILDFVTQQYKLFPYISMCFAFQFAGSWLWNTYNTVNEELKFGQLDNLSELHAVSCVLKAVSSADAAEGVETLRLACGGHGYMTSSNLPNIYGLVTAVCTYEGENTVLLLQTARFLIKAWQNKTNMGKSPTLKYLEMPLEENIPFERSVNWIISTLQQTVVSKINLVNHHINERVKNGETYEDAWNNTSIELAAVAVLHGRTFIVETYSNTVSDFQKKVSPELRTVLQQLLELYAVYTILRSTGDVLRFTGTSRKDIEVIQLWLEELLASIRPNAVGIVDGFDMRDEILSSTLGAYDGNVYQRLFAEAQKSPLNAEPVNKSFHMYLKPFMRSNL
ncbi:probable peroxisomal acyl-coenzyme A oxidase 1, partial [Anoplophora glabripennis]|uniref:probable peroxisomal acyl-coenzyme A oxidase 1 n=1 Tax=Anoplophora glabripennis TaxID=217634 RepID=UPI0008752128